MVWGHLPCLDNLYPFSPRQAGVSPEESQQYPSLKNHCTMSQGSNHPSFPTPGQTPHPAPRFSTHSQLPRHLHIWEYSGVRDLLQAVKQSPWAASSLTLEKKPHVTSRVKQAELINRFMKVLNESVKISGYISKRSIKKKNHLVKH